MNKDKLKQIQFGYTWRAVKAKFAEKWERRSLFRAVLVYLSGPELSFRITQNFSVMEVN